jgi:hypothetical protein
MGQEPVAAPLSRRGYPVRFTKGITGLSLIEEGLLVKPITKYLTLSLPDRRRLMAHGAAGPPRRRVPRIALGYQELQVVPLDGNRSCAPAELRAAGPATPQAAVRGVAREARNVKRR